MLNRRIKRQKGQKRHCLARGQKLFFYEGEKFIFVLSARLLVAKNNEQFDA
jgi:hypothetical protein